MLPCREEKHSDRDRDRRGDRDEGRRERRPRGGRDDGYESQAMSARSRRSDWERETPRSELGDATPNLRLTGMLLGLRCTKVGV